MRESLKEMKAPLLGLFVLILIAIGAIFWNGFIYSPDNINGIIVELHGVVIELIFLSIFIVVLTNMQKKRTWEKSKNFLLVRLLEIVDDYTSKIISYKSYGEVTVYCFGSLSASSNLPNGLNISKEYDVLKAARNYIMDLEVVKSADPDKSLTIIKQLDEHCKESLEELEQFLINYGDKLSSEIWEQILQLIDDQRTTLNYYQFLGDEHFDFFSYSILVANSVGTASKLAILIFNKADQTMTREEHDDYLLNPIKKEVKKIKELQEKKDALQKK